jgi:hypothetical protein
MDKVKVIHDAVGHTLTVWLDDPRIEHVCEETADEVILIKDGSGRVIGVRAPELSARRLCRHGAEPRDLGTLKIELLSEDAPETAEMVYPFIHTYTWSEL